MSLLDRVRVCQRRDLARYPRFRVGDAAVGWVRPDLAGRLRDFPETFIVADDAVRLHPRLADFDSRTRAVEAVLLRLRDDGLVPGWRDEAYPVGAGFDLPPLLKMERAAAAGFGVRAYGVHVNGYVETRPGSNDGLRIWVGRRSRFKPTGPGKLDHLVAGGQPFGIGLMENVVKECAEEAAIPEGLARTARPAGFVSYVMENEEGIRNDVLFAYDLAVPADFTPRNIDGEIEEFFLWPVERVIETMAAGDDFKFNVALVAIDFLVRRGVIAADDPDYLEIVHGLRFDSRTL
jgi:hypothetical protein